MIYYNYQNVPAITINLSIYRGKTKVLEDFSRAELFVWLVSSHDRIPLSVNVNESGIIECTLPGTLDMGVYGLKAIWTKSDVTGTYVKHDNVGEIVHADKTVRAEVNDIFAIITGNGSNDGVINVSTEVATFGYDGLDAYEIAVMKGATHLTEKEWLESRSLTAVLQTEGENTDASMSQAAVTEALNQLRNTLGAAYNLVGIVNALPKKANKNDVYYLSTNKHSYVCYKLEPYTYNYWNITNSSATAEMQNAIKNLKEEGNWAQKIVVDDTETWACLKKDYELATTWKVFASTDHGEVINPAAPVCIKNGKFTTYNPSVGTTDYINVTKVQVDKGDAMWLDMGELTTIDYVPDAKDTQFTPSAKSMISEADNVQDGLDKVGVLTPSMEQNQVIAANINAAVVNMNFAELKKQNDRLIEIIQKLIERVMYNDPQGFKDMSELISEVSFDELTMLSRVTSGGSLSTNTGVIGYGKVGSAVVGKI